MICKKSWGREKLLHSNFIEIESAEASLHFLAPTHMQKNLPSVILKRLVYISRTIAARSGRTSIKRRMEEENDKTMMKKDSIDTHGLDAARESCSAAAV